MKRLVFLKGLFLSCFVVVFFMLPNSLNAQKNDMFFRVDNEDIYNDRVGEGFNISNYGVGEPVPVGSGLLILALTGAGYAVARRRRNRRDSRLVSKSGTLLLAFALLFGMTQCKKNVEQIASNDLEPAEGLLITLRVDNGSKVIVEPEGASHPDWATVSFENGDRIYVANNGKYCGYLDYQSGAFSGTINVDPDHRSESDYLHFYFMGNKTPSTNPVINTANDFYVDITDQTEKYPVISYAHSTSLYVEGKTDYEVRLQNYCAIAKFVTNIPTNNVVTIKGMNNKVTVNFSGVASTTYQPYTYGKMDTEGRIQLHSEGTDGTVKWAILLPQNEVTSATAVVRNYATEGPFTVPAVSAEWENAYMNSGINIDLVRVFTVGHYSEGYTKAVFAPGNLQYKANPSAWRFAEHQWDYVGGIEKKYQSGTYVYPQYGNVFEGGVQCNNNEISTSYTGWIDLFGWGTGNNPTKMTDVDSDYGAFNDWGNNIISYGGTTYANGYWQTPSMGVYEYLINTRKLSNVTISGGATAEVYGWGSATVNGVQGMIFFPDDWDGTACTTFNYPAKNGSNWTNCSFTSNQFTETEWNNTLGDKGCIFIPYAGKRLTSSGYAPYYYNYGFLYCWTSNDRTLSFSGSSYGPSIYALNRRVGASVRLYRVVAEYVND